mgnify:FL=1
MKGAGVGLGVGGGSRNGCFRNDVINLSGIV